MSAGVPMRELPRYKSHKIVHALKIKGVVIEDGIVWIVPDDKEYAAFEVDKAYYDKHKPQSGGYYVVYEDGYKSWSPADAFESGYTRVSNERDMDVPKIVLEKEKFLSVLESGDPLKDFYDEDDLASAVSYLLNRQS